MESFARLVFREIELEYRIDGNTFKGIKQFLEKTNDVKTVDFLKNMGFE